MLHKKTPFPLFKIFKNLRRSLNEWKLCNIEKVKNKQIVFIKKKNVTITHQMWLITEVYVTKHLDDHKTSTRNWSKQKLEEFKTHVHINTNINYMWIQILKGKKKCVTND